jgi:hypothetical protein
MAPTSENSTRYLSKQKYHKKIKEQKSKTLPTRTVGRETSRAGFLTEEGGKETSSG